MAEYVDRTEGRGRYLETGLAAFKRISWGAVFAGVVVALVVQLILSLLGLGIGMGAIDPMQERNPFSGLGTGALVWWVVSILISLFTGGVVAGRLAGLPKTTDSVLHGLLSFSLFTLIMFYLITTAVGSVVSGVGGIVGQTLSLAGQGVASAAKTATEQVTKNGIDLSDLKNEASTILRQTGKPELNPNRLSKKAEQGAENAAQNPQNADNIIDQLFGDASKSVDKQAVVNVIMARTGKSREEANRIADNWIQTYQNSKQKFEQLKKDAELQARKTGDAVAAAMSKAAIFSFIGLVLGALASAVGGKVGEPHDIVAQTVTSERSTTRPM